MESTRKQVIHAFPAKVPEPHQQGGASASQVGGNHYSKLAIQPAEYAHANGLGGLQMNVIKYVTRYRDKNGEQDLRKAIHCLELLIEMEYGAGGKRKLEDRVKSFRG